VRPTPWGTGRTCPHFYKWLGTGGAVSERTANKKLTKLYWPRRKSSPKRLTVLVEPKSGGARPKIFSQRFAPDRCPPLLLWTGDPPSTFKFVPAPLVSTITLNFKRNDCWTLLICKLSHYNVRKLQHNFLTVLLINVADCEILLLPVRFRHVEIAPTWLPTSLYIRIQRITGALKSRDLTRRHQIKQHDWTTGAIRRVALDG